MSPTDRPMLLFLSRATPNQQLAKEPSIFYMLMLNYTTKQN